MVFRAGGGYNGRRYAADCGFASVSLSRERPGNCEDTMRRILPPLFLLAGLAAVNLTHAFALEPVGDVEKIWDKAPHNAFTDLIRFKGRWFCVFREGTGHAAGAGQIRVLRSEDGKKWKSAALIELKDVDLRDPHVSITPDGRLMLTGGAAVPATRDPVKDHYSFVCFSKDGTTWTAPLRVLDSWQWLWRVTWHKGTAYGVAYGWDPKDKGTRSYKATLHKSPDGLKWDKVTDFQVPNATEATLAFEGDAMLCLQRRDGKPRSAMLGRSEAPYTDWKWQDLGEYFGGPNFLRAPDATWYAAGRFLQKDAKTALCRLDFKGAAAATLSPLHILPSGGDNSYPGLVWHDNQLWMSYYSSHESKASIYLARFRPNTKAK
jgi:hypothetical protein